MFQLASFFFFIDLYFMLPWLIKAEVCEFLGGLFLRTRVIFFFFFFFYHLEISKDVRLPRHEINRSSIMASGTV